MANHPRDLTGLTFGWLTPVFPLAERSAQGDVIWAVMCRCGRLIRRSTSVLAKKAKRANQAPRSCGCYRQMHRSKRYKGIGDLSMCRWLNILGHARRKGLAVGITIEQAWQQFLDQGKRCALTGLLLTMSPSSMAAGASTASLDRKDSTKGYVPGNTQWVHLVINDMKSDFSQQEFVDWCTLVARGA